MHEILRRSEIPVVVDADGINALSEHIDVLREAACPVVLTPHDGEFARLGGDLTENRFEAAKQLARQTGSVVLRKGYRTIVTDGEVLRVNTTGNPGMATGGSGDVLSRNFAGAAGLWPCTPGCGGGRCLAPRSGGRPGRGGDRPVWYVPHGSHCAHPAILTLRRANVCSGGKTAVPMLLLGLLLCACSGTRIECRRR